MIPVTSLGRLSPQHPLKCAALTWFSEGLGCFISWEMVLPALKKKPKIEKTSVSKVLGKVSV